MKTNEKLIAITAIVAIFAAGMLMGCIDKEVAETPVLISNEEFKKIATCALDDITYQLEAIVAAKQDADFVTAKTKLATFDASVVEYILIFEEMAVAENALPCKKALINTFEETRILGIYFDAYLESLTIEDYLRYGIQAKKVADQAEIGNMLAEKL